MSEKMEITFRLMCVNAPDVGAMFGLQDKKGDLLAGTQQADGSLLFAFDLTTKPGKDDRADFSGAYVQGTPGTRFLYLSLGATPRWIKRIKVPLSGITWAQIEAAQGRVLEGTVDGRGAATVKLLDEGWVVR